MTTSSIFPQRSPAAVPDPSQAALAGLDAYEVGDVIGSFMGYLRRAKPSGQGLTAQVFGENGEDADFIAALHLTRYLDASVKVSIWMVKDARGRLVAEDEAQLPPFIGRIRRPSSSNMGQTAQFFGENGPNSDAVNVLNQTRYLDALVLVELQKAAPGISAAEIPTVLPSGEIAAGRSRLTAEEATALKRQQKKAGEGMKVLQQHGFFRQEAILRALGKETDYAKWLNQQGCCHPQPGEGACPNSGVSAMAVPGAQRRFAYVPMCPTHKEQWQSDTPPDLGPQTGLAFLQSRALFFTQRWAQDALRVTLNTPEGFLPTPAAVYAWAVSNHLQSLLPSGFMALMN